MKRSYLTLWGQKHLFLPYTMASISKLWDLFFILDKKFIQLVNKSQFVIVTFLKCFFFFGGGGGVMYDLNQILANLDGKNAS